MRMVRILDRGSATILGPLEDQIMDIIWLTASAVTVADVHSALRQKKQILSYSTVKAVLTNLTAKGYLLRTNKGRANSFSPKISRDECKEKMVGEVLDSLMGDCRTPLLAHLVGALAVDRETVADIRRLLRKKLAVLRKR